MTGGKNCFGMKLSKTSPQILLHVLVLIHHPSDMSDACLCSQDCISEYNITRTDIVTGRSQLCLNVESITVSLHAARRAPGLHRAEMNGTQVSRALCTEARFLLKQT